MIHMFMKELLEAMEFDTKMRRSIESSFDQLRSLGKKEDDKYRAEEQNVINGLRNMMTRDPVKFLYSLLEVVGVRGKYKGKYSVK